jgi:hypothetical protein
MLSPVPQSALRVPIGSFSHAHALRRNQGGNVPEDTFTPDPARFQVAGEAQPVRGHLLSDPQHASYPSTHYEIRAMDRGPGGMVRVLDFRDLLDAKRPQQQSFTWNVTLDEVKQEFERKDQQRTEGLADQKADVLPRVLPKDHALRVKEMEIVLGKTAPSDRYFEQLTDLGSVEGFHVIGFTPTGVAEQQHERLQKEGFSNYSLLESGKISVWLEDYGEPTVGGGRINPPALSGKYDAGLLTEAQSEGRTQRLSGLGLGADFPKQGGVERGTLQQVSLAQGVLRGQNTYTSAGYVEYGNMASGVRPDGTPYVLVGKDSVEISRRMLEKDWGRPVSSEETLTVLSADAGVEPGQLFAIEQPGEFHIDMRLMPIGPGEFVLQDSRKAAAQLLQWMQEDAGDDPERQAEIPAKQEVLRKWAEKMAPYEDVTAGDLEAAGMKVHRVAGAFPDVGQISRDSANMFNARHGTNAAGERYSILMGSTPRAEQFFARTLLEELQAPMDRLYFLDAGQTHATLDLQGGLKCRTKSLGDIVVADEVAPSAVPARLDPSQLSLF